MRGIGTKLAALLIVGVLTFSFIPALVSAYSGNPTIDAPYSLVPWDIDGTISVDEIAGATVIQAIDEDEGESGDIYVKYGNEKLYMAFDLWKAQESPDLTIFNTTIYFDLSNDGAMEAGDDWMFQLVWTYAEVPEVELGQSTYDAEMGFWEPYSGAEGWNAMAIYGGSQAEFEFEFDQWGLSEDKAIGIGFEIILGEIISEEPWCIGVYPPGSWPAGFDSFDAFTWGNLWIVPSAPTVIEVDIDIKPGSFPNSINPKSKGIIPVAILTTSAAAGESVDFDATEVDASTVTFGPSGATMAHKAAHLEDVDGDGDIDMILHFKTQDTGIAPGDTEAHLTGQTTEGQDIHGVDSVRTMGKK